MNQGLRVVPLVAGLLLAGSWYLNEPQVLAKWVGVAVFIGLGSTFMVEGLWRGFYAEILALAGSGFMAMSRDALLLGFAILLPAVVLLVTKGWHKFQLSIVNEARTARKT